MMRAWLIVLALLACLASFSAENDWEPNPIPRLLAVPLPYHQVSFQRDGIELLSYHYGPDLRRPFLYPINGPAGRSLTRMGHPHDQESHSHHNSVWVSHNDVNGVVFWGDQGTGTIRHKRIIAFDENDGWAYAVTENEWVENGGTVLLNETRRHSVKTLNNGEYLIVIDLEFKAASASVTLGTTPFGMIGVRMAKSIGAHDGNGRIRNSEGAVNESEVFWKAAKWVDYSGAIANERVEGVTLMDHPMNPSHPSHFHVRNDGWMGASLTFKQPLAIVGDVQLKLRYGLYIHNGMKPEAAIHDQWRLFAQIEPPAYKK